MIADARRRSLSRLGLTLLANYGSQSDIDSIIASTSAQTLSTDVVFSSRNVIVPRARLRAMAVDRDDDRDVDLASARSSGGGDDESGRENGAVASTSAVGGTTMTIGPKPPTILVYTGDRPHLYRRIAASLSAVLGEYVDINIREDRLVYRQDE